MPDIIIQKSNIGQHPNGMGVFAARDFKKGEVVLKFNLKPLTKEEFNKLPKEEQWFTHIEYGIIHLYPIPARYVNHSKNPNVYNDHQLRADIALRDIKKGEEICVDATKDDVA